VDEGTGAVNPISETALQSIIFAALTFDFYNSGDVVHGCQAASDFSVGDDGLIGSRAYRADGKSAGRGYFGCSG
jgi:hypothetical protein